jgi:DNA-binding CsgD family transcriptional regulator/tetratricopeptide (TPR) repeat protein
VAVVTMSGSVLDDRAFVGRVDELAEIAACAVAVAGGEARVVRIEGEAGFGKTALMRQAVDALPASFRVLRAEGDEIFAGEPLATLGQLGPLHAADAFGAGIALLGLLNDAQRSGPVAVVVEDLHWADPTSRLALLTATRRLGADRILVMLTTRPDPDPTDGWARFARDPDRCRRVVLGGLTVTDVGQLAQWAGLFLALGDAERLHEHTKGHPLHLRTLLGELTPEQLTAQDTPLPAPRSLASATTARLSELPVDARDLAAALAVANGRVPLRTAGRIANVGQPAAALEHLLASGFVTWQPGDADALVEFTHPLYRAAVYEDLSPTRRQALHRAAAGALNMGAAFEHRVAATDGVDDDLADELVLAAQRERANGAVGVAARYLLWASSMSSVRSHQERHLLDAARWLLDAGQTARAAALRSRLESCNDAPLRSLVLGELAWYQGDLKRAEHWLLTIAQRPDDDGTDREVRTAALARLSNVYIAQSQASAAVEAATKALEFAHTDRVRRQARISLGFGEGLMRGGPAGLARLAEWLPPSPDDVAPSDTDLLVTRGALRMHAGVIGAGVGDLRAAIRRAGQGAPVAMLTRAHIYLSQLLLRAGDWDEALVQAHVSISLVSDQADAAVEAQAHAALAEILASRGEWETAGRQLSAARDATEIHQVPEGMLMLLLAEAALARARNEPDAIVAPLEEIIRAGDKISGSRFPRVGWWPTLIVATIDRGDIDRASELADQLEQTAGLLGLGIDTHLEALRARLLVAKGDPDGATSAFGRAIALAGADHPLLDRALLHHDFGRLLLARGNRRQALDHLRTAHSSLAAAGATPYRERVEVDLEACGIRPNGSEGRSPLALTDRERDVAVLVSKGMTNREVAAQLYVSTKSIEYHLHHVYGKLGITSRRELRRLAPI